MKIFYQLVRLLITYLFDVTLQTPVILKSSRNKKIIFTCNNHFLRVYVFVVYVSRYIKLFFTRLSIIILLFILLIIYFNLFRTKEFILFTKYYKEFKFCIILLNYSYKILFSRF